MYKECNSTSVYNNEGWKCMQPHASVEFQFHNKKTSGMWHYVGKNPKKKNVELFPLGDYPKMATD